MKLFSHMLQFSFCVLVSVHFTALWLVQLFSCFYVCSNDVRPLALLVCSPATKWNCCDSFKIVHLPSTRISKPFRLLPTHIFSYTALSLQAPPTSVISLSLTPNSFHRYHIGSETVCSISLIRFNGIMVGHTSHTRWTSV